MKRLFTSLFTASLVLFFFQANAQTARMALIEEATQASCPPCATLNPGYQNTVNANPETTIFMAYQVWWPGYDPMFLDNPTEVADRVNYYGIDGAPTVVTQGSIDNNFNQASINTATAGETEFAMELHAEIVNGVLNVTGSIDATMPANGDFRLRIALTEDLITIQDAPGGTNGETEYHHVFKKFITGSEGIDLADSWSPGNTYEINESYTPGLLNVYHFDGLEVIAFIQNDNDKYIHQAAKVHEIEVRNDFNNNASGLIVYTPETICTGEQTLSPGFKLQNAGIDNLTSADVVYSVNGEAEQMVSWTGDLANLETATITLDDITFQSLAEGSTVTATVQNPNGMADENTVDDTAVTSIEAAKTSTTMAELTITTDQYGDETYWQVTNSAGDIVASGGNPNVGLTNIGVGSGAPAASPEAYASNSTFVEEIPLNAEDCYTLTVTDFYGDGMCCSYGQGGYELKDNTGTVMFSGGSFNARTDAPFEGKTTVGVKENEEFASKFSVSPNPVTDFAQVNFQIETAATTTISIVNALGQEVKRQELGKIAAGAHNLNVDMTDLNVGVYMINIVSGETMGTKKVLLSK